MAQPPFRTDVLLIEPGAAGTRTIGRDTTGALKFVDPDYVAGLTLKQLAGLQSVASIQVVGLNGVATIQEAIDAAPTGEEYVPVILVPSGTYTEDITITKNLVIQGLGFVQITNSTETDTISITQDSGGTPVFVQLIDLTVRCEEAGQACILLDGSNTFASDSLVVNGLLAAGDTITIGGVVLTGVAGARTSGDNDFNAGLGSVAALAAEIAAAINDTENAFAEVVSAVAEGADITLTAVAPGSGGNAITLEALTDPVNGITVAEPFFSGGGGVGSTLGLTEIALLGCNLEATGVGSQQVNSQFVNNIRIQGGTWAGSSASSESLISQTASLDMYSVAWVNDLQFSYDSGEDQPSITTCAYTCKHIGRAGQITSNLVGVGSLSLNQIPSVGDLQLGGTQGVDISYSWLGDVTLLDTVALDLRYCYTGGISGPVGALVRNTSQVVYGEADDANLLEITFGFEQADANYVVLVDIPVAGIYGNVTTKNTTGFEITFSGFVTGLVSCVVQRSL